MLPDFPLLRDRFDKAVLQHLDKHRHESSGVLREIRVHRIFEGHSNSIKRPGEDAEDTEIKEISGIVEVHVDEMHKMSFQELMERHEGVINQLVEQQTKHLFEKMQAVTSKTGNVVDGKGKGITPELLLELLEKMEISFTGEGVPNMPSVVVGPHQVEAAEKVQDALRDDPIYRNRWIEIMTRKRKDFFAREANRVLVG